MPSNAAHLQLGMAAEQLALTYLEQQGLTYVDRNFRCRMGEIDLIMRKQQTLVFIEVRSRSKKDAYDPIASIGYHKQQRLLRSAMVYLQQKPAYATYSCRFDVIGITYTEGQPQLHWIKDAFSL